MFNTDYRKAALEFTGWDEGSIETVCQSGRNGTVDVYIHRRDCFDAFYRFRGNAVLEYRELAKTSPRRIRLAQHPVSGEHIEPEPVRESVVEDECPGNAIAAAAEVLKEWDDELAAT